MQEKKIIFIGNSIINGFPYDRNEEFVSLFREMSGNDVINKGINGDTVRGVINRFAYDVISYTPDQVVILVGTNEFIYGEELPRECMGNIRNLIKTSIEAGIEPIILTPLQVEPQMAETRWMVCDDVDYETVNEQITELTNLIKEYGTENSIKVIDTNCAYSEYVERVGALGAFYDGIHPTRDGHKFLAEMMYKLL
ncbi:MAG: GDSL-type esterase/lipase family protein [Aminipila sp.]